MIFLARLAIPKLEARLPLVANVSWHLGHEIQWSDTETNIAPWLRHIIGHVSMIWVYSMYMYVRATCIALYPKQQGFEHKTKWHTSGDRIQKRPMRWCLWHHADKKQSSSVMIL